MNEMTDRELLLKLLEGSAKMQARQEMLECIVRALIVETPPAHPLWWRALHTAKSDLDQRQADARPDTPPELTAAALALWNVLLEACAPPTPGDTGSLPAVP